MNLKSQPYDNKGYYSATVIYQEKAKSRIDEAKKDVSVLQTTARWGTGISRAGMIYGPGMG
jgi:hypothetical protein